MKKRTIEPVNRLTVSTSPGQIYGCTGIFDLCGDADLMSLSFQGVEPFLDYLGWERTDVCKILKNFITWVGPQGQGAGSPTNGWLADACADPNLVEWGKCDFQLNDFGRLRRGGPTRDRTKTALRLCENQPRYRLDGSPINNDTEYDMRIITEVLMQDLKRLVVTGNKATGGQFDGLEQLVKSGYTDTNGVTCSMMDSIVIDWNMNGMSGGAGITWNGDAVGATFDIIDVLLAAYRRVRQRIQWASALGSQMTPGDMVLVMPSSFIDCLLNFYTCWRVCPGTAYNENNLQSYEARLFRDSLNGGKYGAGRIWLHGFEIPILPYDWSLIKGPSHFDMYLLTGNVGNTKLISGQYNDLTKAAGPGETSFVATDGGRLLTWEVGDHTCTQMIVEMQPRLLMWAPWAQVRIADVVCDVPGGVISPDPTETSFYPETSFEIA